MKRYGTWVKGWGQDRQSLYYLETHANKVSEKGKLRRGGSEITLRPKGEGARIAAGI